MSRSKYKVGDQVRVIDTWANILPDDFKGKVMTVVQDHREGDKGGRFVGVSQGHQWWYRDAGVELVEGPW